MEVKRILLVLCLCVVFGSTFTKKVPVKSKQEEDEAIYGDLPDEDDGVQNDDYEYAIGDGDGSPDEGKLLEEDEHVDFITKPQLFIVKIGDTVKLPCEVSNPEVVNIWQKDDVLVSQAHVIITEKYPNIEEFNNGTLVVKIMNENDYGKYACIMMNSNIAEKRIRITHTVVPPTPPSIIDILTDGNKTEYKPGETLRLTCKATGHPTPVISWHKGNERLEVMGETLTIDRVTESDEGVYRCLADNNLQKPSHHHIMIFVEHAPKISVGKYLVTSKTKKDVEMVCIVDAFPEAKVQWRKGKEIMETDGKRRVFSKRKEQHKIEAVFVISNLTDEDFTTYSCVAKNKVGKKEEKINLVKVPAVREFVRPEKANKDVVLTWKVESKLPISAHEIQYRKKGDNDWKVAQPDVTNGVDDIYTVKYTLKELESGSYETRVRSQNEHGWSDYSDVMPFEGESKTLGGSSIKASTAILSIALILVFFIRQ